MDSSRYQYLQTEKALMFTIKHIALKPEVTKMVCEVVVEMLDKLTRRLKEQLPFAAVTYIMAGSFRDKIKISQADEFDVNLIIALPKLTLEKDDRLPGFVKANVTKCVDEQCKDFLRKRKNRQGYIIVKQFQAWFESFLAKMRLSEHFQQICGHKLKMKVEKSGPAHKLSIEVESGPSNSPLKNFRFSVDLVPALTEQQGRGSDSSLDDFDCLAIPKPINGAGNSSHDLFTPSYPHEESELLCDKNHLKNSLRLFKKLRDRQNLGNLKSYHIKTVFLLMLAEKEDAFWNQPTEKILLDAMYETVNYLQMRQLPFYWDAKYNMLKNYTANQIDSLRMQLRCIIKKFEDGRNSSMIFELFLNNEELSQIGKIHPESG